MTFGKQTPFNKWRKSVTRKKRFPCSSCFDLIYYHHTGDDAVTMLNASDGSTHVCAGRPSRPVPKRINLFHVRELKPGTSYA